MPSLNQLVAKLRADYPNLSIRLGDQTKFTPPDQIFYTAAASPLELLHELGHFLIHQNSYTSDIELVRIEAAAWQQAAQLCPTYGITWDRDFAEDHLDTYRDWLHVVSLCQNCNLAGYQDDTGCYHCPLCGARWPSRIPPDRF